ncbi:MAG TPA: thioredoxin domain-containing protein [Terriglobales bacterium]|nr:thioredoxin domain-containing protein [Terriglobales bacterium]
MKLLFASLLALVTIGVAAAPAPVQDPVVGNPKAAVRVIIYQDLECPDCARWHGVLQSQTIPRFSSQVAFEFRDFPLPQHLWSFNAAVLARFFDTKAARVGLAWRDYCFVHQTDFTPDNLLDKAAAWAAPYGITRAQLETVFSRGDLFALVQADQQRGKRDNVQHTPTVLVDGVEAQSPEQLEQMLARATAK